MITQAYFENIQDEILKEIRKAQKNIYVAVAWLTDKVIFHELCDKAKSGVEVELMLVNDTINNEYASFQHTQLIDNGGKVFFVNPSKDGSIMHHKFCVFDGDTVITGSYNWSKKAQQNDENVVITTEAFDLGQKFIREFNSIKDRILGEKFNVGQIDLAKAIKRLDVIKSLILLEEIDDISSHVRKLREDNVSIELIEIIQKIEHKEYSAAIALIEEYKAQQSQLIAFDDPELFALHLELKSLDLQLNAMENEKIEVEKSIHEFSIQYNSNLGKTILEILKLKKELAITEEDKEQAEKNEEEFKEDYKSKKNVVINNLTEAELKELKKTYREASMQCHPDKFVDDPVKMKVAEQVFVSLTEAYKANDLVKVKSILNDLKVGIIRIDEVKQSNKKDILRTQIANFKRKIKQTAHDLNTLKASATYRIIERNTDLTTYFADLKSKLEFELEMLKKELNARVYNGK
jgi:hypothetical protein